MLDRQDSLLQKWVFPDEGQPNRGIGLVAGLLGGLAGWLALRSYAEYAAPLLFPPEPEESAEDFGMRWPEKFSPTGRQFHAGEDWHEALGRIASQTFTGQQIAPVVTHTQLSEVILLGWCILTGGAYGGTRTTTRWRDFAGGFFMGMRVWLIEAVGAPLVGLRRGPGAYSVGQHLSRLSRYWVYTFTTTAVTRVLYRLFDRNL